VTDEQANEEILQWVADAVLDGWHVAKQTDFFVWLTRDGQTILVAIGQGTCHNGASVDGVELPHGTYSESGLN
jgi:hypothetical protein